jgi:hypothetical protein
MTRVRKLAGNGFKRTAQSLRLPSVNPKGLKTFTLSFTVSVYAAGGLQRQDGRMREGARGGKRFRASILQCVFGAPVSGGGNALRMAVAG